MEAAALENVESGAVNGNGASAGSTAAASSMKRKEPDADGLLPEEACKKDRAEMIEAIRSMVHGGKELYPTKRDSEVKLVDSTVAALAEQEDARQCLRHRFSKRLLPRLEWEVQQGANPFKAQKKHRNRMRAMEKLTEVKNSLQKRLREVHEKRLIPKDTSRATSMLGPVKKEKH